RSRIHAETGKQDSDAVKSAVHCHADRNDRPMRLTKCRSALPRPSKLKMPRGGRHALTEII
ncbi:unnamed protein product, partial [Cylindrotheca closterium]